MHLATLLPSNRMVKIYILVEPTSYTLKAQEPHVHQSYQIQCDLMN